MSQLYGLSLLTKDNDQADLDTDETKFISLQHDTSQDNRVLIAGTATSQIEDNEVEYYTLNSVAHGKFSKVSLVEPANNGLQTRARNMNDDQEVDFRVGDDHYLYVQETTGELVTKPIADAVSELDFEQVKLGGLTLSANSSKQLVISDAHDPEEYVELSIPDLKRLLQLLP